MPKSMHLKSRGFIIWDIFIALSLLSSFMVIIATWYVKIIHVQQHSIRMARAVSLACSLIERGQVCDESIDEFVITWQKGGGGLVKHYVVRVLWLESAVQHVVELDAFF